MSLAQWSNMFVYASMAMYSMAMVAFAASFASARAGSVAAAPAEGVDAQGVGDEPVAVGAVQRDSAAQARAAARADAGSRTSGSDGPAVASPSSDDAPLPPGRRAGNIGMSLTWLAFGLLVVALIARAAWAGRAPWGNMYEYSLASAAAITGVFLVVSLRRDVRWLGLFVTMASLITLGVAVLLLYNDSPQLVPGAEVLLVGHPRGCGDHLRGCLHGGRGRDDPLPGRGPS